MISFMVPMLSVRPSQNRSGSLSFAAIAEDGTARMAANARAAVITGFLGKEFNAMVNLTVQGAMNV